MSRVLFSDYMPDNEEESRQNNLELFAGKTLKGSAISLPVTNDLLSPGAQSLGLEHQHIKGQPEGNSAGQSKVKPTQSFFPKKMPPIRRPRGGVAEIRDNSAEIERLSSVFYSLYISSKRAFSGRKISIIEDEPSKER